MKLCSTLCTYDIIVAIYMLSYIPVYVPLSEQLTSYFFFLTFSLCLYMPT